MGRIHTVLAAGVTALVALVALVAVAGAFAVGAGVPTPSAVAVDWIALALQFDRLVDLLRLLEALLDLLEALQRLFGG